jgi:EPS-associated MarR family transcriptional regulator
MAVTAPVDDDAACALEAMRLLAFHPRMSQRELSRALGLSLGKTHYVLRALLDKGMVRVRNFRTSGNKLAYAYLLTPKGVKAKPRLTQRFLAHKEAEFDRLHESIAELRHELATTRADAVSD